MENVLHSIARSKKDCWCFLSQSTASENLWRNKIRKGPGRPAGKKMFQTTDLFGDMTA